MATPEERFVQLLVAEYQALRAESEQANRNMFTALEWGSGIAAVIVGAALTQWDKQHELVFVALTLIVPFVAAVTMVSWLGESERFRRAGRYLHHLEDRARPLSEPLPAGLWWEHWLREQQGGRMPWIYRARLAFLPAIALASWIAGFAYYVTHLRLDNPWFVGAIVGGEVVLLAMAAVWLPADRRIKRDL